MKKFSIFAATALLTLGASVASANFVTGQVTNPNWLPGVASPLGGGAPTDMQIVAGTGTDANGIGYAFSLTQPASVHALTPGQPYEWKVADPGFTGVNFPGSNLRLVGPSASSPISYYVRLAPFGDGLLPEPNNTPLNNNNGWAWSSSTQGFFALATTWNVLGNFYADGGGNPLGTLPAGSANWSENNPNNLVLTDAGFGTPTDGIWGVSITGHPAGSYECKFFDNNTFSGAEMGTGGFGGGNFNFTVLDPTDTISFVLDTRTGRGGVIVQSAVVVDPGFYVVIPGVTSGFTSANRLIPGAAGAGTRSKVINVPTAGAYTARIQEHDGTNVVRTWPSTGIGYPFSATAGQDVIAIFDQNTYTDGYFPSTNILTVLANNPRQSTLGTVDEVQAVGNFQSEASDGLVSDFSENVDSFNLTETGVGTLVYQGSFPWANPSNPSSSVAPVLFKAVGRIPQFASLLGSGDWSIQFGGADEATFTGNGFTMNGNNPEISLAGPYASGATLSMTVDVLTGRAAGNLTATPPAPPTRPSWLSNFTSVDDWMNF